MEVSFICSLNLSCFLTVYFLARGSSFNECFAEHVCNFAVPVTDSGYSFSFGVFFSPPWQMGPNHCAFSVDNNYSDMGFAES